MEEIPWYMSNSDFWGTFWGQFFIELLGGTVSAFIFLFIVLFLFKPKVRVANFICYYPIQNGEKQYHFKFVNRSFFSAHEVKMELYKLTSLPMGGGKINLRYTELKLQLDHISHIPARRCFWNKRNDNSHCIIVRTSENVNEILRVDTDAIMLKISLKHGLTGLSKVFEQVYANVEDIKMTRFKPGTKFGII